MARGGPLSLIAAALSLSALFALTVNALAEEPKTVQPSVSCPPGGVGDKQPAALILDKSPKGEMDYWNTIKDKGDAHSILAYIINFPAGMFIDPAIQKFRANCGDISALPTPILSCPVIETAPNKCRTLKRIGLLSKREVLAPDATSGPQGELAYWNGIKNSDDDQVYLSYLTQYPQGMFEDAALTNYKRTCGDLSALPPAVLQCSVADVPTVVKLSPPIVKLPPPIVKLHPPLVKFKPPIIKVKPPVIKTHDCSNVTKLADILKCFPPGDASGSGGSHGNSGNVTPPTPPPIRPSGTTTAPGPKTPGNANTTTPIPVTPPTLPP